MIITRVKTAIRRHDLIQPGLHILVGVSGGADSIALLALLRELAPAWKLRLTVAHLNHRLRGQAADADARFVRAFARRLNVGYIESRKDIQRLAHQRGISLEMAGREARYAFFAEAARRRKCDVVATAHTADDQAETILLKLARGTGAQGLAGIPYVTHWGTLKIVRPLRDINRAGILAFLRRRRLSWREDATNTDTTFLRNRIRHDVLPFLEAKLNPRVRQALGRMADIIEKENEWLDALAKDILFKCTRDMPAMTLNAQILAPHHTAARRRVLRQWLVSCGVAPTAVDFDVVDRLDSLLLNRRNRCIASLPGGWIARKHDHNLCLENGKSTPATGFRVSVNIPGVTRIPKLGRRITVSLAPGVNREKPQGIGHYPARASLALSAWRRRRIQARSWQPGDRIRPLGMAGSKKVQDVFIDGKVPRGRRHCVPLFECGGEIIWIPGYRIAQDWEVSNEDDKVLQLIVE